MSDVFWTAMFGAIGTLGVAVIVNVFAPGWRDARERREIRRQEQERQRSLAAEEFLASLAKYIPALNQLHHEQAGADILAARQRLIATLGSHDENNIARFTTWLILAVEREHDQHIRTLYINQSAERIFSSLRGEARTLQPLPFTPDRSALNPPEPGQESGDLF